MQRILLALIGGVLIGGAIVYVAVRPTQTVPDVGAAEAAGVVRDIVAVPKISIDVAEQLREKQYADLSTIEEVFALPTPFARSEALYALAGRSDPATVQGLIFDANRIADEVERISALSVMFSRLTDQDPRSALALARTEYFRGTKRIQQTVWHVWGRTNLDDALFAANTETSSARKNLAVQALYTAFGYMGNDDTDRIEEETGIGPDRTTRARYLYKLADRSPGEAVAFINNLPGSSRQAEYVSWLAWYLSSTDITSAPGYAELFDSTSNQNRYRGIVAANAARENPKATLDRLLAAGRSQRQINEMHSAFKALAEADVDVAMQYFLDARTEEDRQRFGGILAEVLSAMDIDQALAWARANERGEYPYLTMSVLSRIAQSDPERALAEANGLADGAQKFNLISGIVSRMAYYDPEAAAVHINRIVDPQQRQQAMQELSQRWMRNDPEAAIEWVLAQDEDVATQLIIQSSHSIMNADLDLAIRLLPRLGPGQQMHWRQQIVRQMATRRSVAEAQQFINQYEGQEGYAQLQSSLISGIAERDTGLARQMAEQLPAGTARDGAYLQIIQVRSQSNPAEAANWVNTIGDEAMRAAATGQVAAAWYQTDPGRAMNWVNNLAVGAPRDDAIVNMVRQWTEPTRAQQDLIRSIGSPEKREQAYVNQIYSAMQIDPARAQRMLEEAEISDYQRERIELNMRRMGRRY